MKNYYPNKSCLIFLIAFLSFFSEYSFAQFNYDEANLTDALVNLNIKSTLITKQDGKIVSKKIANYTFSTKLLIKLLVTSKEDYISNANKESLNGKKIDQDLQGVLAGNNYAQTMQKGQMPFRDPNPPLYSVAGLSNSEEYSYDPCESSGDDRPVVKTSTCSANGAFPKAYCSVTMYREGLAGDGFRLSVYFGNPPVQLGGGGISGSGKAFQYDDITSKCKWMDTECGTDVHNTNALYLVGGTGGMKRAGKGYYVQNKVQDQFTYNTEVHYCDIDTSQFFAYLRNTSIPKTFGFTPGSYHYTTSNEGQVIEELTEDCSVSLTLGLVKRDLEISAVDEEGFHKWLPIPEGEKDYKELKLKAVLDVSGNAKEDSLDFFLDEVSDNLGMCNNYPKHLLADRRADLFFINDPQNTSIQYIDSFHVATTKKVKEVEVLVGCRDYAAFGKLKVYAMQQRIKGKSKYNSQEFFSIPEDDDYNKISDAWEDQADVKMHQRNTGWDEEGEKGKTQVGDNVSFFEEYRGFMVMENNEKKFKRLDPNKREIFVVEENQKKSTNSTDWENATKVIMYRLSDEFIKDKFDFEKATKEHSWRCVDFNGDNKKKAVYVIEFPTEHDPYCQKRPGNTYDDATEWGAHICFFDPNLGVINYFPKRIEKTIFNYPEFVNKALSGDPNFSWLTDEFDNLAGQRGLTHDQLKEKALKAIPLWNSQDHSGLSAEFKRFIILHEMAHNCLLPGHLRDKPSNNIALPNEKDIDDPNYQASPVADINRGHESTRGQESCPMAYVRFIRKMDLVIFGGSASPLFGKAHFCDDDPDKCFLFLDAKNY